ncbi:MAG: molybdopterin-dependent oxidoreductase, partial [Alphaproteobacteria bacterium]|nr:molybdopterin-dependent oxidoreductase [Alphaproteobacteria bacterium]
MNAHVQMSPPVRTTCPYCGVGCGILAQPDGRGGAVIAGDPEHQANFGRLCSKGAALGETLGLATRLLHPMQRQVDGTTSRIAWDAALDALADGLSRTLAEHGPAAIAFYLSGQLLTEDYYVANKLAKGFLGSANVDTNSRLCMASTVAGHRRAFGSDTVPGVYADLDSADLIVFVGSNAAWCHPVLHQRVMTNKRERGAKVVVIDPRRTATAEDVDLVLPLAPGTDTTLFCGLLMHLAEQSALDCDYISTHTTGFADALACAKEIAPNVEATARACGLDEADVGRFFDCFRSTPAVVTAFSQGVNQSAQGTDKVGAIINCHLATGRIGRPGAGPFSLTGQPNAMGGREVGGLANQLAAHMGFAPDEIDRVQRFWQAPRMARREGLKAVQMFDAIARGEIKALWVMGTNPAVSLPRTRAVRDALAQLDLFAVSDNVLSNDTINAGAHLLLPALAWGEKDGTVTNSERRISRQRDFMPPPGEAKPDWWIVSQVARRLGYGGNFMYGSAAEIFREHAALSAFENEGTRDFDIGGLASLSDKAFDELAPVQWPVRKDAGKDDGRFFEAGGYFTPTKKANFVAPKHPALRHPLTPQFPFRLNTGRIRDQWHTMTRSGLSPRLASHTREPFVEVHPADAAAAGIKHGDFARVRTSEGECILNVRETDAQRRGSLFVPIHWSDETASSASVGLLVAAETDPFSGQPEAKATPAAIEPVTLPYRGFLLTREQPVLPEATVWTRVTLPGAVGYLLASAEPPLVWRGHAARLLPGGDPAEYVDERGALYRAATFVEQRLSACLFIGPVEAAPDWGAVAALFAHEHLDPAQRRAVLSGKSADGRGDAGPLVCACWAVGLPAIRATIAAGARHV